MRSGTCKKCEKLRLTRLTLQRSSLSRCGMISTVLLRRKSAFRKPQSGSSEILREVMYWKARWKAEGIWQKSDPRCLSFSTLIFSSFYQLGTFRRDQGSFPQKRQAKVQKSDSKSSSFPCYLCSCARTLAYRGVPTNPPTLSRPFLPILARPQSTRQSLLPFLIRFCGFRSRCTTPLECMPSITPSSSSAISLISPWEYCCSWLRSRSSSSISKNIPLLHYLQRQSSGKPFRPFSFRIISAQCRSTGFRRERLQSSILSATIRSCSLLSALTTVPKQPWPKISMSQYWRKAASSCRLLSEICEFFCMFDYKQKRKSSILMLLPEFTLDLYQLEQLLVLDTQLLLAVVGELLEEVGVAHREGHSEFGAALLQQQLEVGQAEQLQRRQLVQEGFAYSKYLIDFCGFLEVEFSLLRLQPLLLLLLLLEALLLEALLVDCASYLRVDHLYLRPDALVVIGLLLIDENLEGILEVRDGAVEISDIEVEQRQFFEDLSDFARVAAELFLVELDCGEHHVDGRVDAVLPAVQQRNVDVAVPAFPSADGCCLNEAGDGLGHLIHLAVVPAHAEVDVGQLQRLAAEDQLDVAGVDLIKTDAVLLQFVVDVGHRTDESQLLLQKLLGPDGVDGGVLECGQVAHVLQEVQLLPDVVIDLLLGLEPASDEQVGAAEEADGHPEFKLVEDLLGDLHVRALELEHLAGDHDALVVDLVAEVLEVALADLHARPVRLLLHPPHPLLLHHLALLLVQPPVLGTVLAGAVLGQLAVPADENGLPVADLAGLHNVYIQKRYRPSL